MQELLDDILKAIKDNTQSFREARGADVEFKYVDEVEITRAVLTIFHEYSNQKIEEITAKLKELDKRRLNK